ncbi:MAG: segregation/condensation protein A [Thainema sp.]
MSSSLAKNAIAFLIDLAERGEIDPWDVKVIEVIDRFLAELGSLQLPQSGQGRTAYEANLSQSGQAFLYASMLVLLKADTLARIEAEEEVEEEPFAEEWLAEGTNDAPLPHKLEKTLKRRTAAAPPPSRRVTLTDLIEQLELMAAAMANATPRSRRPRPRPQSARQAVRAINQLAHQENLSEIASTLEAFLQQYWQDNLTNDQEWIDFEYLLSLWPAGASGINSDRNGNGAIAVSPARDSHSQHHGEQATDRVGVFWALLFLSAQSKVELSQDEFYGALKVRHLSPDSIKSPSQ